MVDYDEEDDLKSAIRRYLDSKNIFWCNVKGGSYSKPGDPDMIMCLNGKFIAIEAKTYRGKPRPLQERRKKQIENSGGRFIVARSLKHIKEVVDEES